MTIPATARRSPVYVGNGVATEYAFSFKVTDATTLVVTIADENDLNSEVLENGVDYTVTLNPDQDASPGGEITYASLPVGHRLVITSDTDASQPTAITNLGAFHANVLEGALDRIVILHQQQQEQLDRCVKVAVTSEEDPSTLLDSALTTASNSAAAAAASASAAGTSETNAAASAAAAAASESAAGTSETNAAASASAAATSASNASTSAGTASTAATTATNAAGAASTSATNAFNSASAAAASETAAETAETNAEAAQAAAEAALDAFDDRYLGAKASDPTLDNDGNALLTGALYWNTTSSKMNVYTGASWVEWTNAAFSDDIVISGLAKRFRAPFSEATVSNNFTFKTSTTNGNTTVGLAPDGTGTAASLRSYGDSDVDNSPYGFFYCHETNGVIFGANKTGTASAPPILIQTGGATRLTISETGTVTWAQAVGHSAGSAGSPSISFSGDTNTGLYSVGADQIGISTGGTKRVDVSTTAVQSTLPVQGPIGSASAPTYSFSSDTNTGIYSSAGDVLNFSTGGASRAQIHSDGRVYINGTSFPFASRLSIYYPGAGTEYGIVLTPAADTTRAIQFTNAAGADVGNIAVTAAATAYNTSSDYRLKTAVVPLVGALDRVAKLKPCSYEWKIDGSHGEGFIAHELQEVVPHAVTGEKDGEEMQAVDYGKLTPLLAAAIQELIEENKSLRARVAALESR